MGHLDSIPEWGKILVGKSAGFRRNTRAEIQDRPLYNRIFWKPSYLIAFGTVSGTRFPDIVISVVTKNKTKSNALLQKRLSTSLINGISTQLTPNGILKILQKFWRLSTYPCKNFGPKYFVGKWLMGHLDSIPEWGK